jgi:stage V sporulation protein K
MQTLQAILTRTLQQRAAFVDLLDLRAQWTTEDFQLQALTEHAETLRQQLSAIVPQQHALHEQVEQLQARLAPYAALQQTLSTWQALDHNLARLRADLTQHGVDPEAPEQALAALQHEIAAKRQACQQLRTRLEQLQTARATLATQRDAVQQLRQDVAALEAEARQREAQALTWRARLAEHDPVYQRVGSPQLNSLIQELRRLVGLWPVKFAVEEMLMECIHDQEEARHRGQKPSSHPMLHMAFLGNPGTGKTTVARLVGQILKEIGLLHTGNVLEVTRDQLIGRYIGHSEALTMEVVNKALGGVLFIDEAYALSDGDSERDFGMQVINTLVPILESQRHQLIVIFAGYTDAMVAFLAKNPGLTSRVPYQITFPDYSEGELYTIFQHFTAGYTFAVGVEDQVRQRLHERSQQRTATFGNAREVRNMFEDMDRKRKRRITVQHIQDARVRRTFVQEDIADIPGIP